MGIELTVTRMSISRRPLHITLVAAALVLAGGAVAQNAPTTGGGFALPPWW